MNILDRLQLLTEKEGITITAFERIIGASKGVLSRAIKNGTDIQAKWLSTIVENYPRLSAEWLLTGNGDMYKSEAITEVEGDAAVYLRLLSEKDEIIRQQAEQIGMLKAELSHRGQNVENAQSIKPAAAG